MNQDEKDYKAFLSGDNRGFEAIVVRYRENLIYFIYRYVNNLHLAEELAQDVFVEVLLHKERYNFKASLKTYLFTIARNKAVDYIRRHKREVLVEEFGEEYSIEDKNELEAHILKEVDKVLLYQCMKQLKVEYQQAIYLVDIEQMSYQSVAEVLNKSVSQMKVLIHRARKSLKKHMEQEGYSYEI